ncbi:MAG: restriction endonuclease subunit S [Cytophagales bacterium]|jgi:type I restriction enzyme S subunit|nr:restriction endonuclease subunit S [Cytophagales bacterium]
MRKYDSYKESDVEWMEELPRHWELNRLKNIFSFGTGLSITKKNLLDVGVPCVNYGEIHSKYGFQVNPQVHLLKCVEEDYLITSKKSLLKRGDFIFADTSEDIEGSGNFTFLNSDIRVFAGYHTIAAKPKRKINPRFIAYLLDSVSYRSQFRSNVAGIKVYSITQGLLNKLNIFFPTKQEQTAITQYLDTKTQAIDKKISLLEKKIGYYKELRKSIINETVTKGLAKNTKCQVNELGFETPLHWNKKRLKDLGFLYSGLSGKSGDDFNQDDNPNNKGFIPFTNIANNTYLKKDHLGSVVVFDGEKQNKVKEGDIFFLMSSEGYEDIGKSAVLAENIDDTYLNSFCKGFRIKQKNCNPYFLNYLLLSDYYRQILIIEGKGFTRINLKMEKVNDFEVYLPENLSEQSDIVVYLDHKTQTIDKIVGNIQNQITTLKELRKTLINDVVTGKIKVVE